MYSCNYFIADTSLLYPTGTNNSEQSHGLGLGLERRAGTGNGTFSHFTLLGYHICNTKCRDSYRGDLLEN